MLQPVQMSLFVFYYADLKMKKFFLLIFISFSTIPIFSQWWTDGGNLLWPYGDVKVKSPYHLFSDNRPVNVPYLLSCKISASLDDEEITVALYDNQMGITSISSINWNYGLNEMQINWTSSDFPSGNRIFTYSGTATDTAWTDKLDFNVQINAFGPDFMHLKFQDNSTSALFKPGNLELNLFIYVFKPANNSLANYLNYNTSW